MAEDSDLERTEPASPRRLEQAREKGQVPRSRELSMVAVLLAGGTALAFGGAAMIAALGNLMRSALTLSRSDAFDTSHLFVRLADDSAAALMGLAPFLLLVLVVALVAPMLLSGWLFSVEALQPDFNRLNPLTGLGRLFSAVSLAELGKAIGKALLVGGVAAWALWSRRDELLGLSAEPLAAGVGHMGEVLAAVFLTVSASLVLIAAIDVPLQIWQHHRQLRMTREEVRQEVKESEGDPQIKARIRSMQREAARKRMMAEVPKAQVIVTNPTHYAVALRYESGMRAPRVVAKGSHLLAERIRDAGAAHGVPVLQAPPLARALYRHAGLGEEIPPALFDAVAEVLAWVYQLRRRQEAGGEPPQPPRDLPVPAELDPEAG